MVRRRGSVLILTALMLVVAVAIAGEVFQLSRALLERKQLERIAEPAALGAILELDGTRQGIARAGTRALQLAGTGVVVEFAANRRGPWITWPEDAAGVQYVRVRASLGGSRHLTILAAQRASNEWESGLLPLSVEAGADLASGAVREIGYFGDPLPRAARSAVVRGLLRPFRIGDRVETCPLPGEAKLALQDRLLSDSDTESATYDEYARKGIGNGRRLIPVVLRDSGDKASGVAAFFLPARLSGPLTGEYAGGYLQGGRFRAVADSGFAVAEVIP